MNDSIHVSTQSRRIDIGASTWSTRGVAPFRFLALLWWQAPAWVTVSELGRVLGTSTHPRQLQRIVDFLDPTRLIECETRTRGRYRLAVSAEALSFDLDEAGLRDYLGLVEDSAAAAASANTLDSGGLQTILDGLLRLDSAVFDGSLDEGSVETAARLSEHASLDKEWESVLLLRRARLSLSRGAWAELNTRLADIRVLARGSNPAQPLAEVRAGLIAAKSCYDRGRYGEAERLLAKSGGASCGDLQTLGQYHNIAGLCAYRRWRGEMEARLARGESSFSVDATGLVEAERHYRRALLHHTYVSDYQGLQAITFNLANAYLTPAYLGLPFDDAWLEEGLRWLSLCRYIYSHFFVGMDSVWGHILVLRTALATGRDFAEINRLSGHILGSLGDVVEAARLTVEMAERIGNPAEVEAAHEVLRGARGRKQKDREPRTS